MSSEQQNIRDVFTTMGYPSVTYVPRENGQYDQRLAGSIQSGGQLCLITGPSKTGKTSLYLHVLRSLKKSPLIVRCNRDQTPGAVWRSALEQLAAERTKESETAQERKSSASGSMSGKFGLAFLGGVSGSTSTGIDSSRGETRTAERILADPSPQHLIPKLTAEDRVLVVEDFHYLSDETKVRVFQQWKEFIDNRIPVIVIGTTHRAVDIGRSNKDLLGRICQIDLSRWQQRDLEKIGEQGFRFLSIDVRPDVIRRVALEAVGLPIITQQAGQQLFLDKGLNTVNIGAEIEFSDLDACNALHHVAQYNYGTLENDYQQLIQGPRKRQRVYDTYELLLSCFLTDPICFELPRANIDARLAALPVAEKRKPPRGSVTSTLRALENFQRERSIEVLEWDETRKILHILEPAFLFYLRWRDEHAPGNIIDEKEFSSLLRDWAQSH